MTENSCAEGVIKQLESIVQYMNDRDFSLEEKSSQEDISFEESAVVFSSAVLIYLVAEILELAGNGVPEGKSKRITPRELQLAIKGDKELYDLMKI